jgi:hypothetical protein
MSPGPAPGRPTRGARLTAPMHLLVAGGYLLLTLVLTYPIAFDLFSQVPGGGDAWQHIWNLWWVKHALLDLHTNPYHTDLIYYPDGVNLYLHTLVLTAGLIGIPIQLLGLGLIPTYNLIILMSFVLAGYGAFLLCHYLTRHTWASFVGGFVFAFAPYHFAHLLGHMNLASLQWIPFYVLLLLKALDAPPNRPSTHSAPAPQAGHPNSERVPNPTIGTGTQHPTPNTQHSQPHSALSPQSSVLVLAGLLLAVNAYTDWLYGIFLALFTGLLVAWRVLVPSERRAMREAGVGWVQTFLRLAVIGAVALLLVSPVLLPTLNEARQGYAQQPPQETLVYSSDAVLAFVPSELHPIWGSYISHKLASNRNPSERDVFLGYTVLALAAYGAWRLRRKRQVLFWAFIALATWVLSLGPILQVAGKSRFTAFDIAVPLPYLLLYKLPLFNIMRTPARLTVLTMLALGVLVAFTLAALLAPKTLPALSRPAGAPRRRFAIFGVLVPALIAFEFLAVPYPTVPPGWGVPIYAKIAAEPGSFALLELPIRPMGDYMAYQTIHGKPIIGGYLSRQPPYPLMTQLPALKYLQDTTDPSDPIKAQITGGKGVKSLSDLGVKYVIIRWWAYYPDQRAAMKSKLDALLGRPPDLTYPTDQVDAWQLKP